MVDIDNDDKLLLNYGGPVKDYFDKIAGATHIPCSTELRSSAGVYHSDDMGQMRCANCGSLMGAGHDYECGYSEDREDNPSPPTPVFRHTSAADEKAFDTLYEALQKARDILQRGIREGERGHKKALHDAMKVLNKVT